MTIWAPTIEDLAGPRYLAIADRLAADLHAGRLAAGDRLPTHRDLAESLGVTVGTVTRAYAEAQRRGLVHGEVGRGTFVGPAAAGSAAPAGGPIDLGLNLPLGAEDPDLAGALRTLAAREDLHELLAYAPGGGSERHRRAGAAWIAHHGVDVAPDQVIITGGAQHAIAILLGTLCRPGDAVLCESVTYPGLKTVARLLGLRLVPVALDDEGLEPAALDAACAASGARVLYGLPTLHNPTTATMRPARREDIVRIARAHDLLVIEDDVHGLLAEPAPVPLAQLAPERTFYIASTSKVVAGGLRVAFVATPPAWAQRVAQTVSTTLWALPPLTVEVAAMWIDDGTALRVVERKRREAARRQDLAWRLLPHDRMQTAPRSYFLWLALPPPWRAEAFVNEARERGVVLTPSVAFAVEGLTAPAAVRISLSAPLRRDDVAAGLGIVANMLAQGPALAPAIV